MLTVALTIAAQGFAQGAKPRAAGMADLGYDVRTLAQQRPWACQSVPASPMEVAGWRVQSDQCAWQNRLRVRHVSSTAAGNGRYCVSDQARLWSWATSLPGALDKPSPPWRSHWQTNSVHVRSGTEERIIIMMLAADGQWRASEWRWSPSPRPATRRWQAGRWALLVARAAQLRAPQDAASVAPGGRLLHAVIEQTLASRVAELKGSVWHWKNEGLCLRADLDGMGPPQLQLPYALDDSRQEQRAAMQLHLARRFPKATWLTPFSLMPQLAQRRGGAKFYAIWAEEGLLKGQLWMPTRGDGALVRIRIDTPLPGALKSEETSRASGVIASELSALAAHWVQRHE